MNQTTHKMTDPIQIKHYKEDITSFNQLYKEFQRRFVRFANTYVRDLTGQRIFLVGKLSFKRIA
ncbi:hypothetical protein [Phocaeicola vulgatus]|uniref:hypothetical protein n=1 Tax=Phocaeicola vulgatus TaxID=821 RepID=UPI003AB78F44